jgi:hypothetical protein
MIDLEIPKATWTQFQQNYREIDKETQRAIVKGIKGSIGDVAKKMKSEIRADVQQPPMSGMKYGGKMSRWRYPNVSTSLTLLAGRGQRVAQLIARGGSGHQRMFNITELAGSRSSGFTDEGKRMIEVLNERNPLVRGKGGRYFFRSFVNNRTLLHQTVMGELNKLAARLNMELKK